MSKTHQQIKVLRISFVLYEMFQKFRYLLVIKCSLSQDIIPMKNRGVKYDE